MSEGPTGIALLNGSSPLWDEFLMVSGRIDQHTALCELIMCNVLKTLLGCSIEAARAVFYTLDSAPGKKTLLRRVAEKTCKENEQQIIEDLIAGYDKVNNQRREVMHSLALFEDKDIASQFKIFRPKQGMSKPVSKEWLSDLMTHSVNGLTEALKALKELGDLRGQPIQLDGG
jgi:hypothetical protein